MNKKHLFHQALVLAFAFALTLLVSCGTSSAPVAETQPEPVAPTLTLDDVIREVSDYLNERLTSGSKVVFLNFQSDYPDLSSYIIDGLIINAANDDVFVPVDRENLDLIQQEMNFQLSGEVSDESAQAIGKKLGAQTIVSGSITDLDGEYLLVVRAIGVEDAAIQGQFRKDLPHGARLVALTKNKVPSDMQNSSKTTSNVPGMFSFSAPDKPFAPNELGGVWNGTLAYTTDVQSYRDDYEIRLYADSTCWVAITDQDGNKQATEGHWSEEDGKFRLDCEFRNATIARLNNINWLSIYAFQNNNRTLRINIRPEPGYSGVVALNLYKEG
ncbi:MAG: CsgG/HfaB family protein [Spirochaetaceae bacterium]|jgi:hypothetical protein|nr:CsgG/HfaB family protein [Spirochaetaceae bacterium]